MSIPLWLAVAGICLAGAITPGPSLALVLRHTLSGGRRQGMLTGIGHGLAVGLYALATVLGLAALMIALPGAFQFAQWAGALFLAFLGIQGLRRKPAPAADRPPAMIQGPHAFRDGFLMAFLNPHAAVFFLALFSQFIQPATPLSAKLLYVCTALVIDMIWYVSVAWFFSRPVWLQRLERYSLWLERFFSLILIGFALKLILSLLATPA